MADYNLDGIEMSHMHCGGCSIDFYVPKDWKDDKLENGTGFKCPNGCNRIFNKGNSRADKLQRELDRAKQNLAQKDDEIQYQREEKEAAERREAAQKGNVTKIKNRIHKGVCPCCNRSFQNLKNHMSTKHPDYVKAA